MKEVKVRNNKIIYLSFVLKYIKYLIFPFGPTSGDFITLFNFKSQVVRFLTYFFL